MCVCVYACVRVREHFSNYCTSGKASLIDSRFVNVDPTCSGGSLLVSTSGMDGGCESL